MTLGVVLQHRFRPSALKLHALLAEGALGRMVAASAKIRLWRPQSFYDQPGRGTRARDGGGVLLRQDIHTLDLLLLLTGAVEEVTALATTTPGHRMETEDLVAAILRYGNGALGTIEATTAAYPGYPEQIEIAAEHGHAALAGTALEITFLDGRHIGVAPDGSPAVAAPTRWPFPMTGIGRSSQISSTRWIRAENRGSAAWPP